LGAFGHDDVLLPLVACERLLKRLGGRLWPAREREHLGEVAEGVALEVERVGLRADRDRVAGEPFSRSMFAPVASTRACTCRQSIWVAKSCSLPSSRPSSASGSASS
jgi:hypothetical protein